jgi:hypothetical protein
MQTQSIYKVPHGKLLKISLDYDEKNNTVRQIRIMGDFFAYPEEAVEILEAALTNTLLEQESILKKIQSIIVEQNIQFIGLDAEGLTQGILRCVP